MPNTSARSGEVGDSTQRRPNASSIASKGVLAVASHPEDMGARVGKRAGHVARLTGRSAFLSAVAQATKVPEARVRTCPLILRYTYI